jgi:hypothetical protein
MARPDLNKILEMLDEENIAKAVHLPHAIAREQYHLQKVTVQNWEEFQKEIGRYYVYQMSTTMPGWKLSTSDWLSEGYAEQIVEKTFAKIGGAKGACQMAQKGINGGLKAVVDSIFDWIVNEQVEIYFNNILQKNISPMEWQDQVDLMYQLSNKFGTPGKPVKNPMELAADYKEYIKFIMERLQVLRSKISR